MSIDFAFVKMGTMLEPQAGKLILDVGNRFEPGIIDHHHIESKTCATRLLMEKPEYISGWIDRQSDSTTVILHENPDLDCVCVAYLALKLLGTGNFSDGADLLASYVCDIDQGVIERPNPLNPRIYEIFEMIRDDISRKNNVSREAIKEKLSQTSDEGEIRELHGQFQQTFKTQNNEIVQRGFALLDFVFPKIAKLGTVEGLFQTRGHPFEEEALRLSQDLDLYERDLRDHDRVQVISLPLPAKGTGIPIHTDGLFYRDPQASHFKLWARTDKEHSPSHEGFVFMLVEWSEAIGASKDKPKYVISVDHTAKVNLVGLGDVLNFAEEQALQRKGIPLVGAPRPGYRLPDPWYDGRGHDFTIVDTPRDGTQLERHEIEQLVYPFMDLASFCKISPPCVQCRILSLFEFEPDSRREMYFAITSAGWTRPDQQNPILTPLFRSYLFDQEDPSSKQLILLERRFADSPDMMAGNGHGAVFGMEAALHNLGVGIVAIHMSLKPESSSQLFHWQNRWQQGTPFCDLFSSEEEQPENFPQAIALLNSLPLPQCAISHSTWNVVFEDAHLSRDPGFYERLLATFVVHKCNPGNLIQNDIQDIRGQLNFGQFAYLVIKANGIYLFQNHADQFISQEERRSLISLFNETGWHVFLNAAMQKGVLDRLTNQLARTASDGFASKNLRRKLQRLREQSMDVLYRSITTNLTTVSLTNELWERLAAIFKMTELREKISTSIDELSEYVETKRTSLMDRVVMIVSLIIAPLTLLTDYLGGILSARYPTFKHFFAAISISYSLTLLIGLFIYLAVRDKRKKTKAFHSIKHQEPTMANIMRNSKSREEVRNNE